MSIVEIILVAFGAVVFILSFLLPAGKKGSQQASLGISEKDVKEMVEKKVEDARGRVEDIIDETVTYAIEKTERSMERLTNEKIMAINEYSDTVLDEINKNHKEVVFLYDMLNDKQETLKSTVSEAAKTASQIKQSVRDAEITAIETQKKAKEIQEAVGGTVKETAKEAADEAATQVLETEFVPISAPRVEIIYPPSPSQPEAAANVTEETQKPKKRSRKNRAARTAGKEKLTAESGKEAVPAGSMASADIPEEAVLAVLETAREKESEKPVKRNNNDRILELHKAGKSDVAIARELGLGVGEVKLVIGLFEGV